MELEACPQSAGPPLVKTSAASWPTALQCLLLGAAAPSDVISPTGAKPQWLIAQRTIPDPQERSQGMKGGHTERSGWAGDPLNIAWFWAGHFLLVMNHAYSAILAVCGDLSVRRSHLGTTQLQFPRVSRSRSLQCQLHQGANRANLRTGDVAHTMAPYHGTASGCTLGWTMIHIRQRLRSYFQHFLNIHAKVDLRESIIYMH